MEASVVNNRKNKDLTVNRANDSFAAGDQAFSFVGSNAFTNQAGQLRYEGGILMGDTNGDGVADFAVQISNHAALTSTDFFL